MAELQKFAIWSATEKGYEARRDGLGKEACPFGGGPLRAAWLAGWQRANGVIF